MSNEILKPRTKGRVQYKSELPSMTQQHLKDECDVNSILERYRKTGNVTHINLRAPQGGDFTRYNDFKANLDMVMAANDEFQALPAQLRKKFGNDPAQLVSFLSDDKNYEEAEKLGLVTKQAPKGPQNDDQTTKKDPLTPPAT